MSVLEPFIELEINVHLSLSTSSYSDVINGIDKLWAAPLCLCEHHQDTAKGKQAWTESPHFSRSLNQGPPGCLGSPDEVNPLTWWLCSFSMNAADHH